MANFSALRRYLGMDADWNESIHHRSDNGRFTSGSGRGKAKEDDGEKKAAKANGEGRREMSEERAEKIVRKAFAEAKKEIKGMKHVGGTLHAYVDKADSDTLKDVNAYLTARGLKANIQDANTYHIAEDGYDDIQVVDDPMLGVLVCLCAVEMVANDLHYRAGGKSFYGLHILADLVKEIGDASDDLNEVHYMGEKGEEPPERAFVAAKAAELVGQAGDENALLAALAGKVNDLIGQVEVAKNGGVASGTAAVLDEISKKALQAKGLLARTQKSADGAKAIDNVIGKGFYIKPEAEAQDAGTSEGAKKGWETRNHGGGTYQDAVAQMHADERSSRLVGSGEIHDEGRSSKSDLTASMNREIARIKAADPNEPSLMEMLTGKITKTPEERRRDNENHIKYLQEQYAKMISAAPDVTEHKWVYHA